MDEKLPTERSDVRPQVSGSELIEADGWLPAVTAAAVPTSDEPDEPQRPETD